ncbi:Bacterial alpha-L-rhamnosidase [Rubripirellula obstinata]|uniref:Bacterial alpha-L-rhamnosidase n=1 Tax=Rubripirellula obstinata TaxID=406547 RepID=A0A5B1CH55_9BACT|nr:alpha-L-rhamnosidase C-terminal domain-containing protein [Rubripirellula obstinata]KAA1259069.1 Bacterial alpha-L-rhamnosidase [Rubripirellula obstinata]
MNRFLLLIVTTISLTIGSAANSAAMDWKAHWIWQAKDGPANTWVAFRKEFEMNEVPEKVLANISTDTKYWLWINGEMVLFEGGLARGPHRDGTYYDEVELQPFLKPGKNSLAILVWYWGKTAKTHEDSGKGGLVFSADLGETVLQSDRSWMLKVHPAYDPKSKGLNRSANRPNAMDVKFDARKAMGDWSGKAWYSADYSMDESWKPATEKGVPPAMPWGKLVKRPIPHWNDRGLTDYESLRIGKKKITLPYKNEGKKPVTIFAKLPKNKQITPYLKVNSNGGRTIKIGTDNSWNLINAQYTTKHGVQSFETYSWMSGHAVKYTVPPGVEVQDLQYRWTGLGSITGTFQCSDPFFERLWSMAANTLYICSRDCYMDCPDRERGLWIGDVADQTGAVFYTLGEPGRLLLKKGIDNTIAYQNSDIIQGLAPGFGNYRGKSSELTAQSLQYIDQGIWRYYFNTGDKATLANAYPSVLAYLKLWNMEPSGLPEIRKGYASWVDWGTNPDKKPVEVCWYYIALDAAKKMAMELDKPDDIGWYDERIQSIAANFDKIYWRDGYYGSQGAVKDERVSALAILNGLADPSKYSALLENVLTTEYNASPHMEWIVEEAIMLAGDHAAGLKRMRERYQSQVDDKDLTTLCEKFGKKRGTPNHAWNAPNYVLSRYIAGIAADEVAWKSYHVLPNLAHLTAVKQVVPSVQGDISVDIKLSDKNYTMHLISPAGTKAVVGIPKASIATTVIMVNGSTIWENGTFVDNVSGISWNGESSEHLKFDVASGTWTFTAKAD